MLAILVISSGCATHSPMSEVKMYQHHRVDVADTLRSGNARSLISGSYSPIGKKPEMVKQGGGKLLKPCTWPAFSTGKVYMRKEGAISAISYSVGLFTAGFDMTFDLFPNTIDNTYLTLGFSNRPDYFLAILQRRLFDATPIGLSLGFHVSHIVVMHERPKEVECRFCLEPYYDVFIAYGPRAPLALFGGRNPAGRPQMLFGNFSVNYVPTLDLYYPTFSLSVVLF